MRAYLLAALVAFAGSAHAECKIGRVVTVPLTLDHNRAMVPVTMNDHEGQFELDTGAETTVLYPDFARAAHVGMDRRAGQRIMVGAGNESTMPIWSAHVRMTQMGELKFQDWEYDVLDHNFPGEHGSAGLLGSDFLHYFDVELDFPAGKMTLWRLFDCKDVSPPWTGTHDAIDLKPTKGHMLSLPIWIDDAFLDVMLDTGAEELLLTREAARKAGLTDAALAKDSSAQGEGLGGAFRANNHRFKLLLIGSGQFPNADIAVDLAPNRFNGNDSYQGLDGILGLKYLRADRVWISYGTHTLYLQSPEQAVAKK